MKNRTQYRNIGKGYFDLPKNPFPRTSGREVGTLPDPKIKPGLALRAEIMPKTFSEINRIALERRLASLEGLSKMDLSVLLATLNRQRVPLSEADAFARFYLEVANRYRA
jgi:hypothetical protein